MMARGDARRTLHVNRDEEAITWKLAGRGQPL